MMAKLWLSWASKNSYWKLQPNSLAEGVSPSGSHRPRQRLHPRHDSSSKAKYGRVLPSLGSWRGSARGSRPVTLYCLVLVKQSTEFRWFAGCLPKVRMVPVPCSQAGVRRWVFPCPVPQPLLWINIKEMSRTCLLRSYWNHSRSITEFSSVFSEQLGLQAAKFDIPTACDFAVAANTLLNTSCWRQ